MQRVDESDLKYLVEHIFLPPRLPQKFDPESHRRDGVLLEYVTFMSRTFYDILSTTVDEKGPVDLGAWNIIPKMLTTMGTLYNDDGGLVREKLQGALQRMQVSDVLPVFVEAQNAAIIFRKITVDKFTFEAFEVSLPCEVVMKAQGKISMRFPTNPRLPFPADKLVLSTLANVLAHLSTSLMEEAIPVAKKGGEEHHEFRNTASPRFITEALAGIIRATPPKDSVSVDTVYIQKRLDDHVLWKSALQPWRRSSMWLIIRVAMQTTLEEWGAREERGYKAFQAVLMASLLDRAAASDPDSFTCELITSMNMKLVKRLYKLSDVLEGPNALTLGFASDAVFRASKTVGERWKEIQRCHEGTLQWTPPLSTALKPKRCLEFSFPHSRAFLLDIIKRHKQVERGIGNFSRAVFEASLVGSLPSRASLSSSHLPTTKNPNQDAGATLHDFEIWVEVHLNRWEQSPLRSEQDSLPLASVIGKYREMATSHYKNDPERISLTHLCVLELWVALDRICVKWCPLLQQYSPEIVENFADPLLLPYSSQVKRLALVQSYLRSRHQLARAYGSRSIFRQPNDQDSFANKYFKCSTATPLIDLEERIRADAVRRKAAKVSELKKCRTKYDDLMNQAQALACSKVEVIRKGVLTMEHAGRQCQKCQLQSQSRGLKITPIEDLLPEDTLQARPIVFELNCPIPFAAWRDATITTILSITATEQNHQEVELYPLREYDPLRPYFREAYKGCRINFASTAKALGKSHYKKGCKMPAVESQVLFNHKGSFNVFDAAARGWVSTAGADKLRAACTFQVDGLYAPLQIFVNDTQQAPNSILASLSKCPIGISPTEYTTFGLLRAGNRLQWRNIMRAIRAQTLSFSDPSVLVLIIQSIWQTGPAGEGVGRDDICREAHRDLLDEHFGKQVAEELLRTIKSLGSNWKQVNFLAIPILLALRLQAFSPHPSVHSQTRRVLEEARRVALEWISILQEPRLPSIGGTSETGLREDHKPQALANVAVVLQASFDAESDNYAAAFRCSKDIVMYIYAKLLISAVQTHSFPSGLRILASRNHRLSLALEPHLIQACRDTPSTLKDVANLAYPRYSTGSHWESLPTCHGRWWTSSLPETGSVSSQIFHMNIMEGKFLINGKAFDQLPADYMANSVYVNLFNDHVFCSVRPSTMEGMHYQGHYGAYEVHFRMINEALTILRRNDTDVQEYIEKDRLEKDLPLTFSTDHCFWYSRNTRTVEIRRLSQAWTGGNSQYWAVRLQHSITGLSGRVERMIASGIKSLVDPSSQIYRTLVKTLAPLESDPRGFFMTVLDKDTTAVSVYLPRHDLTFSLRRNELECLSLPGYIVDSNLFRIGCLFGLKSMLNLRHRDLCQPSRKVIVPKGSMATVPGRHGHIDILIHIGESKGYFVYDVDEVLGRLVGTRTMESDLYLAKLHAFTTSPLPDPLTQQTGTIEALNRLASAASFSFHTISKESQSYLDDMLTLSPIRTFYPTHLRVMETVKWNNQLPVCVQHPEFRSRVERIMSSWRDMEIFLPPGELYQNPDPDSTRGSDHLYHRAMHRDWVCSSSSNSKDFAPDLSYDGRDSLTETASSDRENIVFQAAILTREAVPSLSPCKRLQKIMTQWNKIEGMQGWGWDSITDWLSVPIAAPIADTWCTFYKLCCSAQGATFDVSVALAFQCFRGVSLELIATLGAVVRGSQFSSPAFACPKFSALELDKGCAFRREIVLKLVQANTRPFEDSEEYYTKGRYEESEVARMVRAQGLYQDALQSEAENLVNSFYSYWPNLPPHSLGAPLRLIKLSGNTIQDSIEPWFISWVENKAFLSHIEALQHQLNVTVPLSYRHTPQYSRYSPQYPPSARVAKIGKWSLQVLMNERTPNPMDVLITAPASTPSKLPCNQEEVGGLVSLLDRLESVPHNRLEAQYLINLRASLNAFRSHPSESYPREVEENFLECLQSISLEHSRAYLEQVTQCLQPSTCASQMMQLVGIWPTVTPQALLRCLSLRARVDLSPAWAIHLIGYAISIHDAKRATRMLQLARDRMNTLLERELRYVRSWQPLEHPDWLLVEIESNLSIRPTQATIADEMLSPDENRNTVMQLNMGEGKSSVSPDREPHGDSDNFIKVIVPIVAASASAGSNLARVVVPRAQMKQQFHILRQTLTGLCDRRVIYLPFNRNVTLDAANVARIHELLRNGATDGTVWVCEPEQLMSLKMLGIDKVMRGAENRGCARNLIELNSWLHHHSKDILDESDEILHAKQQVVYTVGLQQSLDAAPLRWEIIENLLGLLPSYLAEDVGDHDFSSFLIEPARTSSAFPVIRIQSETARFHLHRLVATSICNSDWPFPPHMNELVIDFVTSPNPSDSLFSRIRSYCLDEDARVMQTILILRGLIGSDILMHSLKERRWRVQYGLDLRRSRLAIPFRAKDCPSPRSEFGHPDVIILLTCLSYYYAGLEMEMVIHALQSLLSSEAPELTYVGWMRPCWEEVPVSLRTINGINLQDEELLRTQLFPLLRYNKSVIDFYLNSFIFPSHAREFPSKLSTSGWDIATLKPNPTVGFSGTNDGRFLLPVTIKQTDREAQLHTNAKVIAYILKKENSCVVRYPNFIGAIGLLDRIHKLPSQPTVILDVGAQILDLSNEAFSRIWLAMYQDHSVIKAAVFFDEWDNLLVLTSDGGVQAFIDSPYLNRLDQCLVYLDEAHTRGTDLRIPPCTQAVVTLGPKMSKDKLVQGCMRMRRLGDGHTLVFMVSEEVVNLIHTATGSNCEELTAENVVLWSIKETWKQLQANLPAWVLQGHSFIRREAAWTRLYTKTLPSSREISNLFCEPEARTIEELYGKSSPGTEHWIWDQHSINSPNETIRKIVQRCKDFDSFSLAEAGVQEEMEIELVHEKEVEREVEMAPDADPAPHILHPNVESFVTTGDASLCYGSGFRPADKAFEYTSLVLPKGFSHFFANIVATEDFYRTINTTWFSRNTPRMDRFIRPVDWVVTAGITPQVIVMVLFSPYEVEKLLPRLRTSKKVTLHVFSPRTSLFNPSFEDLNFLSLPSTGPTAPLSRPLAMQLNLFSGSLYFRDYQTYSDVCRALRLHFGLIPAHLAKPNIINASFFVLDPQARVELGMTGLGFQENALPFFQNMIRMRRFGRGFGPSHIGKVLHGNRLRESDFVGGVIGEQDDMDMVEVSVA